MRRAAPAIAVACLSCSGSPHLAADAAPEAASAADGRPESAGELRLAQQQGAGGEATCRSLIDAADPTKCHPCTPVPSCLNPCDGCELCIDRTAVAPTCGTARTCPSGHPCEAATAATDCPAGSYCLTGCCVGG